MSIGNNPGERSSDSALRIAHVVCCEELQMPVRMLFISTEWDAKYPSVVQEDDVLLQD